MTVAQYHYRPLHQPPLKSLRIYIVTIFPAFMMRAVIFSCFQFFFFVSFLFLSAENKVHRDASFQSRYVYGDKEVKAETMEGVEGWKKLARNGYEGLF